jgi:hypothetical protein
LTAWVDYIPVYVVERSEPWRTSADGYIPFENVGGGTWTPLSLFASSEVGAWYDPSDLDTMLQQPTGYGYEVTTVAQAVGLIMDKSQELALGTETFTNWDVQQDWSESTASGPWSVTSTVSNNDCRDSCLVTSSLNKLVIVIDSLTVTTGDIRLLDGSTQIDGAIFTSAGTYTVWINNPGSANLRLRATAGVTECTVSSVSCKVVAGNHAYQDSVGARPVLRQDGSSNYYLEFDGVDDFLLYSIGLVSTDTLDFAVGYTPQGEDTLMVHEASAGSWAWAAADGDTSTAYSKDCSLDETYFDNVVEAFSNRADLYTLTQAANVFHGRITAAATFTMGYGGYNSGAFTGPKYCHGIVLRKNASALTTAEKADLTTYLGSKAGVTL